MDNLQDAGKIDINNINPDDPNLGQIVATINEFLTNDPNYFKRRLKAQDYQQLEQADSSNNNPWENMATMPKINKLSTYNLSLQKMRSGSLKKWI